MTSTILRCILLLTLSFTIAAIRWDRFSTKTSYFWHLENWNTSKPVKNEYTSFSFNGKTCRAFHINALVRHGSEYPSLDEIDETAQLQVKLKSLITNSQYDFMKTWTNPYSNALHNSLIDPLGKEEEHLVGESYGTRLFDMFQQHLGNIKYVVSDTDRAKDSAKTFHGGVSTAVTGTRDENVVPEVNDRLIQFNKYCPLWKPLIDDNKTLIHDYYDFRLQPPYIKMMHDVSQRLGFHPSDLKPKHYNRMHKACSYELGVRNRTDTWCALMTDTDREVLEYEYDLKYYFTRGYGQNFSRQMSCPLMRDFFLGMDNAVDMHTKGMNYTPIVIRFGHSDTRGPFYDAIGLFKDATPLRATNFESMRNRKYKCSHTGPFASSLVFVLYSCSDDANPGGFILPHMTSTYAIRMFVNEEPHVIPACNSDTCWYKDVRDGYKDLVNTCHFNDLCALATTVHPLTTHPASAVVG